MIGPLFLLNGVSLQNIFFGLLLGNLMAVLALALHLRPYRYGSSINALLPLGENRRRKAGQSLQSG